MSDSGSEASQPKPKPFKVFVTGMDGSSDLKELEQELRKIFEKYGEVQSIVPKRSYNGAYCFAFVDFKEGEDATLAVEKENNCYIGEKKVTIELQDNSRRRKGAEGCYECGKPGHFARECRNKSSKNRRGRSRSDSSHKKKKRKHSYSSDSYSRSRSFRKESKEKLRVNHRKEKTFEITEGQEVEEQEQEAQKGAQKKQLLFGLSDYPQDRKGPQNLDNIDIEIQITLEVILIFDEKEQYINICARHLQAMNRKASQSQRSQEKITKQEASRSYGCPCGKFYLSYPALFTHVKQKHEGKPPGALIKPESGKIRGRPKTKPTIDEIQQQANIAGIIEGVQELIDSHQIKYEGVFQKSQGNISCQDIASTFISQFQFLSPEKYKPIECFLNLLKWTVIDKYGEEYWANEKPEELIELANQIYLNHENNTTEFPLPQHILKELIFNYFQWLYFKKLTDHRLQKRDDQQGQDQ